MTNLCSSSSAQTCMGLCGVGAGTADPSQRQTWCGWRHPHWQRFFREGRQPFGQTSYQTCPRLTLRKQFNFFFFLDYSGFHMTQSKAWPSSKSSFEMFILHCPEQEESKRPWLVGGVSVRPSYTPGAHDHTASRSCGPCWFVGTVFSHLTPSRKHVWLVPVEHCSF